VATIAHRGVAGEKPDPRRGGEDDRPVLAAVHASSHLSLKDRLLGTRDRILANPGFQRFAGTFAPTRPIARRRASALFDLCAGFVYSQILLACVRLKLFDHLAGGPLGSADLSARLSLPVDSTVLLLDAAVSLKLAQRRSGGRYGLGPLPAWSP
jgi:demethylspheroidene O-methyltransferase